MTTPTPRIVLIIPAGNTAAEVQFQRYAPPGVGVHTTRLRMTGKWFRPLSELADDIVRAAEALSDTSPGVIVFHCTANSMAEGQAGEARILELVEQAGLLSELHGHEHDRRHRGRGTPPRQVVRSTSRPRSPPTR